MFDFPNNPVVNQSVTAPNGGFFIWDGLKWTNGAGPGPTIYLPLAGGTMGGPLTLSGNATQPLHAVPLQQINTAAAGGPFLKLSGGTVSTPASLPSQITITPTPPSLANAPNGAQFLSYMTAQFTGGTLDDPIFSNILASTQIQGAPVTGIWALNSELTYQGTGGNGGYVASAGQAVRAVTNAGGTANNPQLWGALFNYIDKTNTDSAQANYGSALEIGIACGNTDSANNRRMLGMYLNKFQNSDVAPTCHLGIQIAANVGSFDYMFHAIGQYNIAAFDLRSTTKASGAHTIWLKDGNDIVWNTAATATTYWDSTLFSGAGGIHIDASTMISGSTFYTPNGITTGLVYCTGTASLLGGGTFNGTFAGNHTYSGAVTVSGGLQSTSGSALSGGAAWSSFVLTKDLIVSHNGANPALGILDSTGANGVAITNQGSSFNFYAMPALTDTTTAPTALLTLATTLATFPTPVRHNSTVGFNNTAPIARPTVSGAKGSNAALASLLTALAAYGLVTDSTTA